MPHVSKNANFSEKGIKNARLATLFLTYLCFLLVSLSLVSFQAGDSKWPVKDSSGEETEEGRGKKDFKEYMLYDF